MVIFILVLGLSVGSFAHAMVDRMLKKEDFVKARSKCDKCEHQLAWYDLIPLVSWLSLKGRCRYCSKKLSAQHPLYEFMSGFMYLGLYLYWPLSFAGSDLVVYGLWLVILAMFIALIIYDIKKYELPDSYLLVILLFAVVVNIFNFELKDVLLGTLVGGGFFHLLYLFSSGKWIGFGDVKLGYVAGFLLGLEQILVGTIMGFYIAALFVLPLLVAKKLTKKSRVPFGPFLILGYYLSFLFSGTITDWFNGFIL